MKARFGEEKKQRNNGIYFHAVEANPLSELPAIKTIIFFQPLVEDTQLTSVGTSAKSGAPKL